MHPNATLLADFYAAFGRLDAEGMVACYAPGVTFSDPVFQDLSGDDARAMWRMLCERAKDFRVEASGIEADDRQGRAHWEAWYTFSATGARVHNIIDARFSFEGGKIVQHTDSFDLARWAGMALGWKGKVLGWLPPVQSGIRRKALAGLRDWRAKSGR
jgi:ketosteroid isomerase-like protein